MGSDLARRWYSILLLALLGVSGCQRVPARESAYPSSWWAPVPKDGAPAWEILPQEAGPGSLFHTSLPVIRWQKSVAHGWVAGASTEWPWFQTGLWRSRRRWIWAMND
jgi:hypothetical protein